MTSGFPCILYPFPHTATRQSKRAKNPAAVEGTRDARTRHPTRHAFPIARPSGCIPERRPIASSWAKPAATLRSSQPCGELGHRRTPHRQARQPNLGDLPQRIRLCFGTPVNWRTRRGSANAWLKGTLLVVRPHCTRRNPIARTTRTGKAILPYCAKSPGEAGAFGPRVGGGGVQHAAKWQRALLRRGCVKGACLSKCCYFSFAASFTFSPRLATTGMVMALAGQASTQERQRVQSASVRSPYSG